jgi:hypothetical protein
MIGSIRLICYIGIGMLFLPYFGIPNTWKLLLAILVGIALIVISFMMKKQYKILKFKLKRLEQPVFEQSIHE